jgi:hypothetical protein
LRRNGVSTNWPKRIVRSVPGWPIFCLKEGTDE